jgi:hypothetical protein
MNNYLKLLLEEKIKQILKEDDGGGDYGGETAGSAYSGWGTGMGMGGGGGVGTGTAETYGLSPQFLLAMGITPLWDIVQTAAYAIKSITASAQHIVRQLIPMVKELLIPFYHADYKAFEQERLEHLGQIDNKYANVLGRNEVALKDHDLWGMFFMLYPEQMLSTQFIRAMPELTEEVVELVGFGDPHKHQGYKDVGYFGTRPAYSRTRYVGGDYGIPIGRGVMHNSKQIDGKVMKEDASKGNSELVNALLTDPKVLAQFTVTLKNNGAIKDFIKKMLDGYVKLAEDRLNTPTFAEVNQKFQGALGNIDQQIQADKQKGAITPGDVNGVQTALAIASLQEYQEQLVEHLNSFKKDGSMAIPFIDDTIKRIKAIKQPEREVQQQQPPKPVPQQPKQKN